MKRPKRRKRNQEISAIGEAEIIPASAVVLTEMPDGTQAVQILPPDAMSPNPRRNRKRNLKIRIKRKGSKKKKKNSRRTRLPKRNAKGRFTKAKKNRHR